jgi:hypothetical protein
MSSAIRLNKLIGEAMRWRNAGSLWTLGRAIANAKTLET